MAKIKHFLACVFIVLSYIQSSAQVIVHEDPKVSQLMAHFESSHYNTLIVRGWRIQIATTNDRRTMETSIERFKNLYPERKFTWEHNPPFYVVKTGAYLNKADLESDLLELKNEFYSSIPVRDDIEKTEFIND